MNFYERQAAARLHSRWLIVAFALAITVVVLVLTACVLMVFVAREDIEATHGVGAGMNPLNFAMANPDLAVATALFWLAIIMGASVLKSLGLRDGGGSVARALGGTRVDRSTTDPDLQRLRNVVEEMALASGVPVPETYVLDDEHAINAFAAGHSPANAAVTVTRGTLNRLTREELQGVIAHEFSHILNGDMRLNIRMIGWLYGLMVIAIIGRTALRLAPGSRKGGAAMVATGAAMMVLGYLGLGLGRLIQAGVSRQRERLADASAVQFTRNPQGLKGAFLKIAAMPVHGRLGAGRVDEIAHMLFVPGISSLLATHPSLGERIQALDPQFDPRRLTQEAAEYLRAWERARGVQPPGSPPAAAGECASGVERLQSQLLPAVAPELALQVGNPDRLQIAVAREMRLALPAGLLSHMDSPPAARALMLAVLLAREPAARAQQLALIGAPGTAALSPEAGAALAAALPLADSLSPWLRLPAVLELFPALRRLARGERIQLSGLVMQLGNSDRSVDLFEFCLARLVFNSLIDELEGRQAHGPAALGTSYRPLGVLFSVLAWHGAPGDPAAAARSFQAGIARVLTQRQPPFEVPADWPRRLWTALTQLEGLNPIAKRSLIEALVATIAHDEQVTLGEAELLRTVCAVLQCPLPPLLPGVQR